MTSSYLCVLPSLSTTRASHRRASSEPSVLSTSTIRYPTGSTPASLRNCSTSSGGVPGTATVAVAPPHISAWYTPGPPLSLTVSCSCSSASDSPSIWGAATGSTSPPSLGSSSSSMSAAMVGASTGVSWLALPQPANATREKGRESGGAGDGGSHDWCPYLRLSAR